MKQRTLDDARTRQERDIRAIPPCKRPSARAEFTKMIFDHENLLLIPARPNC